MHLEKALGWRSVASAPDASQIQRLVIGPSNLTPATLQQGDLLGKKLLTLSSVNSGHTGSTVFNLSLAHPGTYLPEQGNRMRPTVLSRLAARLTQRKSGWNVDWVWVAFVLAVLLLIAAGIFMSVGVSAPQSKAAW